MPREEAVMMAVKVKLFAWLKVFVKEYSCQKIKMSYGLK
jgi:hypothetical protein